MGFGRFYEGKRSLTFPEARKKKTLGHALIRRCLILDARGKSKANDFCVKSVSTYRVTHKSLRDFRTRLRNNQDRHGRKEHINR